MVFMPKYRPFLRISPSTKSKTIGKIEGEIMMPIPNAKLLSHLTQGLRSDVYELMVHATSK